MKEKQMWEQFISQHPEYKNSTYSAWSYGELADELAELTVTGVKTATASAYDLYAIDEDPLPTINELNIILNSKGEAICITKTVKVSIVPFLEVTKEHAYKEGEGDRSLESWRTEHARLFTRWFREENREFNEQLSVVCEEFEVVYS